MNTVCLGDWGQKICNETNWLVLPPCIRLSPFHSLVFHQPSTTTRNVSPFSFALREFHSPWESLSLPCVFLSLLPLLASLNDGFLCQTVYVGVSGFCLLCSDKELQPYSQYIFLIFAPHSSLPTRLLCSVPNIQSSIFLSSRQLSLHCWLCNSLQQLESLLRWNSAALCSCWFSYSSVLKLMLFSVFCQLLEQWRPFFKMHGIITVAEPINCC